MKTEFRTWSVCALSLFKDILACQADAQTPYSWITVGCSLHLTRVHR